MLYRVSPITILEDAPTKTPANTQDSDLQSGTQSPSHMDGANEEINEIFEGLSEHVHSALMDVHAMCCEGAQEVLEQVMFMYRYGLGRGMGTGVCPYINPLCII
ncbi:hypothetical protein EON63_03360 [archaeon]|nr:MAG: hypothetical protein EON63_03360 [archaeon]